MSKERPRTASTPAKAIRRSRTDSSGSVGRSGSNGGLLPYDVCAALGPGGTVGLTGRPPPLY
ncbi:hypothetical protein, partial [Streptomyces sp. T21Q-yed]|uniref:hypothetical protein n=1 Tax=Streptomyces sp. T21Q-yed TaxID=3018441 RepID=UPI0023DEF25D